MHTTLRATRSREVVLIFTISKRFEFSASHVLDHLPADHPCSRLHGHNYAVELVICAPGLDARGFVLDYRDLDRFKRWVDDTLDHRHLNDVLNEVSVGLASRQPSAENLARFMFEVARDRLPPTDNGAWLSEVRVMETAKTVAVYRP